jgi:hypothetical protein
MTEEGKAGSFAKGRAHRSLGSRDGGEGDVPGRRGSAPALERIDERWVFWAHRSLGSRDGGEAHVPGRRGSAPALWMALQRCRGHWEAVQRLGVVGLTAGEAGKPDGVGCRRRVVRSSQQRPRAGSARGEARRGGVQWLACCGAVVSGAAECVAGSIGVTRCVGSSGSRRGVAGGCGGRKTRQIV